MVHTEFFTIGVYETESEEFFRKLVENEIDTFIDIRRRRAMRGTAYAFVNSNRLQNKLAALSINYLHLLDLAPTEAVRKKQKDADAKSGLPVRQRTKLSDDYVKAYKKHILAKFNFEDLFETLDILGSKKAVFFCIEKIPEACHRSLVTEALKKQYGINHIDL